jgi:hypothetical protein
MLQYHNLDAVEIIYCRGLPIVAYATDPDPCRVPYRGHTDMLLTDRGSARRTAATDGTATFPHHPLPCQPAVVARHPCPATQRG